MRKFTAVDGEGNPTHTVPGVPARDLTEDEWALYTKPLFRGEGKARVQLRDALIVEAQEAHGAEGEEGYVPGVPGNASLWEKVEDSSAGAATSGSERATTARRAPPSPPTETAEKGGEA